MFLTAGFNLIHHCTPHTLYFCCLDTTDEHNLYFFKKLHEIHYDFKKEAFFKNIFKNVSVKYSDDGWVPAT